MGKTYYTAQTGNDENPGTFYAPFRTIGKASLCMMPGDICYIREGVYREVIKPVRNGEPGAPISYCAYPGEQVTITGTEPITGWEPYQDQIYKAFVELPLEDGNQVFVNGEMVHAARWPKMQGDLLEPALAVMKEGTRPDLIVDREMPDIDWKGGTVWCWSKSRWVAWTSTIETYENHCITFRDQAPDGFNQADTGGNYYLTGKLEALTQPGEWHYDPTEKALYLWAPEGTDPASLLVEAKYRETSVDLDGCAYSTVQNLTIFGSSLSMKDAVGCIVDGIFGRYISHRVLCEDGYGSQSGNTGCILSGRLNVLKNSEIAYSSGNGIVLSGSDNQVVNCHIHHIDYSGTYASGISIRGSRHLISHNTVRHTGRSSITGSPHQCSIQYNHLHHCGLLSHDLGLVYFFHCDGAGTEMHHNVMHDNLSDSTSNGLYLDNGCKGFVVHHNLVYNIPTRALVLNMPNNYNLIYNNTFYNPEGDCAFHGWWGWNFPYDMLGVRVINNIFGQKLEIGGEAVVQNNLYYTQDPCFSDPANGDYTLDDRSPALGTGHSIEGITDGLPEGKINLGAYQDTQWKAGHDFNYSPDPVYKPCILPYMNRVYNPGFENGTMEGWTIEGECSSEVIRSVGYDIIHTDKGNSRSGSFSIKLGAGKGRLIQKIEGLHPNTDYMLAAWVKIEAEAAAALGISDCGLPDKQIGLWHTTPNGSWVRQIINFRTGPEHTAAVLYLEKTTAGFAAVYADDFSLSELESLQEVWR